MRFSRIALIVVLVGWFQPASAELVDESIAYLRFTAGHLQVWVTDPHGREHRQVTFEPIDKTRASWSADRSGLLCNRNDGTLVEVSLRDLKSTVKDLPLSGMLDAQWSPDNQAIAFSLISAGGFDANDIWVIEGKTEKRKLTRTPGHMLLPAWGDSGKYLIYARAGKDNKFDLWRVDALGKTTTQLTVGDGNELDPSVSPDGDIAYAGNRFKSYDIWLLSSASNKPQRLTTSDAYEAGPSWSNDGQQLAYYSLEGNLKRIWVINRDGTGARPITPVDALSRSPAWYR